MQTLKFSDLDLVDPIQTALTKIGYQTPTPIQKQTIPLVLKGLDVLGIAQTGTGKTAAFSLPIINHLYKKKIYLEPKCPRALVLAPTRELAIQIHQSFEEYGQNVNQKYSVIFGGVGQGKQVADNKRGVDVLVATPGRLLDLVEQDFIKLNRVEIFVLDEADRMLDMGFVRDIQKIIELLPKKRHNLFFSATMPNEIQKLAASILHNPQTVAVTPPATTVMKIDQSVMFVDKKDKVNLLVHLLKNKKEQKTLVFVEMKHVANRVTEKLETNGIRAAAIHGNKTQGARQRAIQDFTNSTVKVMVATDIASRGIDIDGITHVINYELSNIAESYVHRIGRTARAGAEGKAISLVTSDEKSYLANIEKTIDLKIKIDRDQPYHSEDAEKATVVKVGKAKKKIENQRQNEDRKSAGNGGSKKKRKFQSNNRFRKDKKKKATSAESKSKQSSDGKVEKKKFKFRGFFKK